MSKPILDNEYIRSCDGSAFTVLFNNHKEDETISFIHALLDYGEWHSKVDLFRYVREINNLRKDKKTYFVLDASTEGFSPFEFCFFDVLYNNCRKYKIPPSKILFVSANLRDKDNLKKFNKQHKIKSKQSIKVFSFCSFRKMISDMVEDTYGLDITADEMLDIMKNKTCRYYNGHFGLSLSRVNRPHRTLANYLIHQNKLSDYFLQSNDKLSQDEIFLTQKKYNLDKNFQEWCSSLPLIADTKDFETNHALALNVRLHSSTIFQIVNETHVDNSNNTSLFFSEKTFRSIAHMQPFLIFGQTGCNQALKNMGFQLYDEIFDYTFDDEPNVKERYKKIIQTSNSAISRLKNLSREEQIKWKFSVSDKLKYNFQLLLDENFERDDFKELIKVL